MQPRFRDARLRLPSATDGKRYDGPPPSLKTQTEGDGFDYESEGDDPAYEAYHRAYIEGGI